MSDDRYIPPPPFEHRTSDQDMWDYSTAIDSADPSGATRKLFRRWAEEDNLQEHNASLLAQKKALEDQRHHELISTMQSIPRQVCEITSEMAVDNKTWLTKKQAAAHLGVSERTIDRMREDRRLRQHVIQGTGSIRFKRDDLDSVAQIS